MTIHCVLVPSLDEGDINPKVLQLISNEKIQVRKRGPGLKQDSCVGSETRICFLHGECPEALCEWRGMWVARLSPVMLWTATKAVGTR